MMHVRVKPPLYAFDVNGYADRLVRLEGAEKAEVVDDAGNVVFSATRITGSSYAWKTSLMSAPAFRKIGERLPNDPQE
jgi:hypothetical protein